MTTNNASNPENSKHETAQPLATDFAKLFYPEKLTSRVFNTENPPKDWADIGFLVPHEFVRREELAMLASIDKLKERLLDKSLQSWQVLYFCEWFVDVFQPNIHAHHDNEEDIYFPWIKTRVEIPEKSLSKGHRDLIESLDDLADICGKVIGKEGVSCDYEITRLHTKMHAFVEHMDSHLMEEERDIPHLLRANFTEEEEQACVQKIIQRAGFGEMRREFPALMEVMEEWATKEYMDDFYKKIPGPILYLVRKYHIPDYETTIKPKRDAPFSDTKPTLRQKGCCGIPFLFRCIC